MKEFCSLGDHTTGGMKKTLRSNHILLDTDKMCCVPSSGYYFPRVGIRMCSDPALRLNGYTRSLPSMPGRELFLKPWPKSDAWIPPVRRGRGEYYGYYNERIEKERIRRHRELPITQRIDPSQVPTFAYNSRWGFDQP